MVLSCQAFTQSIQHNRTTPARQPCVTHAHHDSRAGAPQRYIAVSTLTSARVAPPLLPAAFPASPACSPPIPALLPGSQHTPHRTARSRHTSPRCPLLPAVPMSPAAASPPQLPAAETVPPAGPHRGTRSSSRRTHRSQCTVSGSCPATEQLAVRLVHFRLGRRHLLRREAHQ